MKRIALGLAIHSHQPVGNFPAVFEQAYSRAYLPFLEALERHPSVRVSLHYSGPLLDWLLVERPDFVRRVAGLARSGQVEMMTGGYYEPILPAIPDVDLVGQVRKMTRAVKQHFGTRACGLWLAERVWEPGLPAPLAEAGVDWTVVDDAHFEMAGVDDAELFGYYLTEDQGRVLKLFASSKRLRYIIPWRDVDEVIAYLRSEATEDGAKIAVMGDDGEKFGLWPDTHDHCWTQGWMERFFTALERNAEWLQTVCLSNWAAAHPPVGRVYLPTASYAEMMEWALPARKSEEYARLRHALEAEGRKDVLSYMRGGFWRMFLSKYPEANLLHKKMLRVHAKVHLARALGLPRSIGALDDLWKGQCNCPYWHGVFGGLYLADVRSANYRHLLRAESAADRVIQQGPSWLQVEESDYDSDGLKEVLVETRALGLYLRPAEGGSLCEWDIRGRDWNAQSTVARRPEAYHAALKEAVRHAAEKPAGQAETIHAGVRVKDVGESADLDYDRHPRYSLIDHVLPVGTTLEDFARCRYREMGDFAAGAYRVTRRWSRGGLTIRLERDGHVLARERTQSLRVRKDLRVRPGSAAWRVAYHVRNTSDAPLNALFAPEWNLNMLAGGRNPLATFETLPRGAEDALDGRSVTDGVEQLIVQNSGLGVRLRLRFSAPVRLWRFSVESVSNSEAGVERLYQGTCLTPLFSLDLAPCASVAFEMAWSLEGVE